jgi:hypothetical protein
MFIFKYFRDVLTALAFTLVVLVILIMLVVLIPFPKTYDSLIKSITLTFVKGYQEYVAEEKLKERMKQGEIDLRKVRAFENRLRKRLEENPES